MKKPIFFIRAKFDTFADLADYTDEETAEVLQRVNHLPSCTFRMGFEDGQILDIDGGTQYASGKIAGQKSENLLSVTFDGWFKIDAGKRRDSPEIRLTDAMNQKKKITLLELGVAGFIFEGKNKDLKEGDFPVVEGEITLTKPNVDFENFS